MLHWLGEVFQLQGTGYAALPQFLTSLGIGLLLGIERERKQDPRAGVRTFALTCLFGTLSGHVAGLAALPLLPIAGLVGVALLPVPFVQQFVRKPVLIDVRRRIRARARVAVPIPGAPDV